MPRASGELEVETRAFVAQQFSPVDSFPMWRVRSVTTLKMDYNAR